LVVRLPDGRHAAVALSDTDYLASPEDELPARPDHLLDLHGLRQVLRVLDRIARERRPTTHDHSVAAATDDPRSDHPIVPTPSGPLLGNVLMKLQRPSTHLVVAPSQVWDGLAAEDQAAAIRLLARLASNLVAQQSGFSQQKDSSCFHNSAPPRSDLSISTARP